MTSKTSSSVAAKQVVPNLNTVIIHRYRVHRNIMLPRMNTKCKEDSKEGIKHTTGVLL